MPRLLALLLLLALLQLAWWLGSVLGLVTESVRPLHSEDLLAVVCCREYLTTIGAWLDFADVAGALDVPLVCHEIEFAREHLPVG